MNPVMNFNIIQTEVSSCNFSNKKQGWGCV